MSRVVYNMRVLQKNGNFSKKVHGQKIPFLLNKFDKKVHVEESVLAPPYHILLRCIPFVS